MQSELDQIQLITGQLLSVSKPHVAERRMYDLVNLLNSVVSLASPGAFTRHVQIVYTGIPTCEMYCNENQIRQAFLNVIKNGIESMQHGGQLSIELSRQDSMVIIRFIDHGVGIDARALNNLFKPFYTTKDDGTGLGLMMTRRIIESHGGKIEVSSTVDNGTTVIIKLPCED